MTIARTRTQFRAVAGQEGTFEVLERTGSRVVCLGRVARYGSVWAGLGICADAWTTWHSTRRDAVADMRAGRTYIDAYIDQLAAAQQSTPGKAAATWREVVRSVQRGESVSVVDPKAL